MVLAMPGQTQDRQLGWGVGGSMAKTRQQEGPRTRAEKSQARTHILPMH